MLVARPSAVRSTIGVGSDAWKSTSNTSEDVTASASATSRLEINDLKTGSKSSASRSPSEDTFLNSSHVPFFLTINACSGTSPISFSSQFNDASKQVCGEMTYAIAASCNSRITVSSFAIVVEQVF